MERKYLRRGCGFAGFGWRDDFWVRVVIEVIVREVIQMKSNI